MKINHYSPATGEDMAAGIADFSSLEPDVPLIPAYATPHDAPAVAAHQVAVFRAENGAVPEHAADGEWQVLPDWRGVPLYSIIDGVKLAITEIGKVPSDISATELPRPSPAHLWIERRWQFSATEAAKLDERQREVLRGLIGQWRDQQEQSPIIFKHIDHDWDGGVKVKTRLDTVAALPALPADYFWTDANNNDVPMDLPSIKALRDAHEIAIATRGWQIHQRQRHMKTEIETLAGDALLKYQPDWPSIL